MEKQVAAIIIVFLFCLLYTVSIAAQAQSNEKLGTSARASNADTRAAIQQLGFGRRVNVKLKNASKTTGRITGFDGEHFIVTDSKGAATAIAYSDVSRISKQKEKLGIFHRPWVGIMFTAAGVGTLVVLALQFFD
jgi:small nuclear ribonucleoprotein (snRNP)-like protein